MAKENAKNIGKETKKRNLAAQQPNKKKTSVKDYFKGIRIEMKKVVWPTKKELGSYTAVVVLTAVYLGSSAGFLTGSFSALISNFYFGQGPWTPFQMLAWGIIGFLAGILRNKLKNRITLSLYGVFAGILYSVILELWNVLWYSNSFDINLYLAFLLSSLPHTAIYAVSNVIFLMLMYKPIGSKLKRAEQRIFA